MYCGGQRGQKAKARLTRNRQRDLKLRHLGNLLPVKEMLKVFFSDSSNASSASNTGIMPALVIYYIDVSLLCH